MLYWKATFCNEFIKQKVIQADVEERFQAFFAGSYIEFDDIFEKLNSFLTKV